MRCGPTSTVPADGTEYVYLNDPAKGTLNQIAIGYAADDDVRPR